MTLRTRIAAAAGVAVAVTTITAAVVVYLAVRSNLRGEVERALTERAAPALTRVDGPDGPGGPRSPGGGPGLRPAPLRGGRPDALPLPPPRPERFGGAEGYVQRVSPDGEVFRPPGQPAALPITERAREIAARGEGESFEDVDADGTHVRVLTVGLPEGGAIQVARPLTEVDRVLDRVLVALVVVGLAGIGLAALLGAGVARVALAPVARFTRRTEELTARPVLSERIEVAGRDELSRLAHSFNTTLEALERAVEAQRQLVADASHELRTPIASLRANVQTLEQADRLPRAELDALRADIVAELDELTGLVADVVELARGAQRAETLDDVRLHDLVAALVERAERRGKDVAFRTDLESSVVQGEPDRIARAVSNLLDNAVKWSPAGGTVEVTLRAGTLTVRDHGPGFAAEDLPHVFERFYRARAARGLPGSGLGLAIVRQAAEAHGGWARAANAADGGAVLAVRFGDPVGTPAPAEPTLA